jgi:hypothetical protein
VLQRPYRFVLESITSALQLMGTIAFVLPEILDSFPSVPVDWELKFDFHHVMYFWFAFAFCNLIWIVVPILIMVNALKSARYDTACVCLVGLRGGGGGLCVCCMQALSPCHRAVRSPFLCSAVQVKVAKSQ